MPRWPRGRSAIALLAVSLVPVVTFLPVLLGQWTSPARADAIRQYRADRRATVARGAAWLGSAGLVAAIVLGAGVPAGAWLGADLALAAGAGLFAALATGPYPMVKLTELILLAQWRQPASLHRVLTDAAARQVLVPSGARWEFRDVTVRARLAAAHAAELRERDQARAARAARATGARARLVAAMDARGMARARADLAAGIAIFLLLLGVALAGGGPGRPAHWGVAVVLAVIAAAAGLTCYAFAPRLLRPAVAWVQWTVANVAPFSRRTRLAAAVAAVAAAALLIVTAGPALAALAAAVLPAVLVTVTGGWVLLVTRRAPRPGRRAAWWHRRLQDAVVAATTGTALLVLARRDVLAAGPAAGLLFPLAAWAAFRAWRAMDDSGRVAVRAAADITLSLLLGADLVLFLVWLANRLGLSRAEVAALRGALERAGGLADLPWWLWAGLYAALAAAAVAFAIWPARLRRASGLSARLRVVPVVDAARRVLTGVHIGLLVTVAVAAPPRSSRCCATRSRPGTPSPTSGNLRWRASRRPTPRSAGGSRRPSRTALSWPASWRRSTASTTRGRAMTAPAPRRRTSPAGSANCRRPR